VMETIAKGWFVFWWGSKERKVNNRSDSSGAFLGEIQPGRRPESRTKDYRGKENTDQTCFWPWCHTLGEKTSRKLLESVAVSPQKK